MGLERKTRIRKILEIALLVKLGLVVTTLPIIRPYEEPEWYQIEWERMQECSRTKNIKPHYLKLNWPLNDGFPCWGSSKGCTGVYVPGIHTIFISSDYIKNKSLVRHEQLHSLGIDHGTFLEKIENGAFPQGIEEKEFLRRCEDYYNGKMRSASK